MKKIPIGISDFKKLINENYYFIDKSSLINEILEDGSEVILLPRPRRFGKTINMSMLKYFFEKTDEDNSILFKELEIYKYKNIMEKQGKYPVIYITFKDLKDKSIDKCYEKIKEILSEQYNKFKFVLDDLSEIDRIYYNDILLKRSSEAQYETSLKHS